MKILRMVVVIATWLYIGIGYHYGFDIIKFWAHDKVLIKTTMGLSQTFHPI